MISIYVCMNLDMILNKVFNTLGKYQKWCYIPTIYVDILLEKLDKPDGVILQNCTKSGRSTFKDVNNICIA